MTDDEPLCDARAVFWPADVGSEVACVLPAGHEPADLHEDAAWGLWGEGTW